MEIREVEGRQLAIGVEWEYWDDADAAKAAVAELESGAVYFQIAPVEDGEERWFAPIPSELKLPPGLLAAAPYCGLVEPDALIAWAFEPDRVWLCALSRGMPVVGCDQILSRAQARQEFDSLVGLFPTATRWGDLPGALGSVEMLFAHAEQALADDSREPWLKQLQQRTKQRLRPRVVALLLAALACSTAYFAWEYFSGSELLSAHAPAAAQQDEIARQVAMREARQRFEQELARERLKLQREALAPTLQQEWRQISALRRRLPLSRGGYRPTRLECKAGQCVVAWAAVGPQVSLEARQLVTGKPSDAANLSYTPSSTLPYALPKPVTDEAAARAAAIDAGLLRMRLIDTLKRKLREQPVNVGENRPVLVTPEPAAQLPAATLGQRGEVGAQIGGGYASVTADRLVRQLQRFPAHLDSVVFQLDAAGGVTAVELKAHYSVVQAQQPPAAAGQPPAAR